MGGRVADGSGVTGSVPVDSVGEGGTRMSGGPDTVVGVFPQVVSRAANKASKATTGQMVHTRDMTLSFRQGGTLLPGPL